MVLVLSTLPLIGIEAMSTRQQTPQNSYDSAVEALTACQTWRQQEGVFTALTPPMHRIAAQPRRIQTGLRSCEADLEQALIIGRRYSVVAESHYDKPLHQLNRPISQTFPYMSPASTKPTP
ncbi:MAG: hypothetical protein ACJ0GX_10005 [Parasynechococcus sp.]|jgi:hypothetical protein|uniref:hypothetical protein n=1 Tax=Parasynechococcus sp. TaxID=3101203 RepID=UPI000E19AC07|nr:MAG: hypothetical protein DBW83_09515 [Synechococcus sp. MED-G69]|tara:strand:- start:238 stop:600 length:363 start_codon:yes stop_codon:yes gene_type:complete